MKLINKLTMVFGYNSGDKKNVKEFKFTLNSPRADLKRKDVETVMQKFIKEHALTYKGCLMDTVKDIVLTKHEFLTI